MWPTPPSSSASPAPSLPSGHLVGFSWRSVLTPGQANGMEVTFHEFGEDFTQLAAATHFIPDCQSPPHDFVLTPDYYIFFHHQFSLDLVPFLLGLKGPAECMVSRPWLAPATATALYSRSGTGAYSRNSKGATLAHRAL